MSVAESFDARDLNEHRLRQIFEAYKRRSSPTAGTVAAPLLNRTIRVFEAFGAALICEPHGASELCYLSSDGGATWHRTELSSF